MKSRKDQLQAIETPGQFAQVVSDGKWRMARHHRLLDRELMAIATGKNRRLIIQEPPRHGKSEHASKYFPAWYLGRYPEKNIILASANHTLATDFSAQARDLLKEHGSSMFGMTLSDDATASDRWLASAGGGMRAVGVGTGVMGRGANLFIVDDYFGTWEEAMSPTMRDKIHRWYHATAQTRLTPDGAIIIIATRYHRDDLIGRLLKEQESGGDRWRVVRLAALAEEQDELGRQPGEPLWPEQWSREKLEQIRESYAASGYPWMWEALYQQNPPTVLDAEFNADWFGESIWFDEWPSSDSVRLTVITLDPSLGETDRSDYSAYTIAKLDSDGTVWIDADLQRRDPVRMVDDGIAHWLRHGAEAFGVESNGFQKILGQLFEDRSRRSGMMLPIHLIPNTEKKTTRIRAGLTPYLARGQIRFRRNSPGCKLLLDQLRAFPAAKHDDGPDSLEMALRLIKHLLYDAEESQEPEFGSVYS